MVAKSYDADCGVTWDKQQLGLLLGCPLLPSESCSE